MNFATCHEEKPAVSPLIYVMDDDLNFYVVTYRDTVKAQNLTHNPQCSFTIWQFLQMSVQAAGAVSIVEDEAKKDWVMDAFADVATRDPHFWAPIFRMKRGDYAIFKITPTWMRVLDLSSNTVRQEKSPFTDIVL